jgi:hypothetical protein
MQDLGQTRLHARPEARGEHDRDRPPRGAGTWRVHRERGRWAVCWSGAL